MPDKHIHLKYLRGGKLAIILTKASGEKAEDGGGHKRWQRHAHTAWDWNSRLLATITIIGPYSAHKRGHLINEKQMKSEVNCTKFEEQQISCRPGLKYYSYQTNQSSVLRKSIFAHFLYKSSFPESNNWYFATHPVWECCLFCTLYSTRGHSSGQQSTLILTIFDKSALFQRTSSGLHRTSNGYENDDTDATFQKKTPEALELLDVMTVMPISVLFQ